MLPIHGFISISSRQKLAVCVVIFIAVKQFDCDVRVRSVNRHRLEEGESDGFFAGFQVLPAVMLKIRSLWEVKAVLTCK
jgi:hypothetical protein